MQYRISFRQEANAELTSAYIWYEGQQEGLGERFVAKIQQRLTQIINNPEKYKVVYKNYREITIEKFPYQIVYVIEKLKRQILIIAVFHTKRNPAQKYR